MTRQEFIIDLSEDANSPLEALQMLSVLDPNEGFHISNDIRPPLGVYNISISRVCNKVIKCCDRLENYFNASIKVDELRKETDLCQDVIDNLELALYAAAEHVDDVSLIAKGFFPDDKKYKKSTPASQLRNAIKKNKALISATINAIKHKQARIRIFSQEIQHATIKHCIHGYFVEGVHNGEVGPNKIFHGDDRHVFSITSLMWEIICFLLNSSHHLNKFLKDISEVQPNENPTNSKIFIKAIIAVGRLPAYSFDDIHPFSETKITINSNEEGNKLLDSNIYGSIMRQWSESKDIQFFNNISSYEGDGITKTFKIVKPMKLGLQHWG